MTPRLLVGIALVVTAPLGTVSALALAQRIRPDSRVWVTGASNIRRFTCNARELSGAVDLRGVTTRSEVLAGDNALVSPSLRVTVDKLDCGIGIMNRHLHEALQAARQPTIEFRLTTYEVDLTAPVPVARIAGVVTIAGVRRPVSTTATVHADTLGSLHVSGSYDVRPTDFGVSPPRRFAGLLRVRDRATVHFDVALDQDGDVLNDITCRLLERINTKEGTHASHS
jgi:polyisoprenoid-binding protein YceI